MPNLKSLLGLIRSVKNMDAVEKTLAGGGGAAVGGLAALYSVAQKEREQKEAEEAALYKKLKEGIGTTGSIETRPTADIASRIDTLKENIPNIKYGWKEITEGAQAPYRSEQKKLEQEMMFRRIKEALRKE